MRQRTDDVPLHLCGQRHLDGMRAFEFGGLASDFGCVAADKHLDTAEYEENIPRFWMTSLEDNEGWRIGRVN